MANGTTRFIQATNTVVNVIYLRCLRALQLLGYPVRTFIEGQLPKLDAVGSSPVSRSIFNNLTRISHQLSAVARGKAGMTGREACPTGLSRVHTVIRVGRLERPMPHSFRDSGVRT
jgi:hypothetical protein